MWRVLKPAFCLMASRRQLLWLENLYKKIILLLTWVISSTLNISVMLLWSQSRAEVEIILKTM